MDMDDATTTSKKGMGILARISENCTETARRCHHMLRTHTEGHVNLRWMLCFGMIGFFLFRIIAVPGFYVVAYAFGIYLLNQWIIFLSPLNEISLIPRAEDDSPRRVSEYLLWLSCIQASVLSVFLTFIPLLDIPVFTPVLVGYFVILMVFAIGKLLWQRWSASKEVAEAGTVHIRLLVCSGQNAIQYVRPWSAIREPPSSFGLKKDTWHDFLRDAEQAMFDGGKLQRQLFSAWKLFACTWAVMALSFQYLMEYLWVGCESAVSCNRRLMLLLAATHLPVLLHFVYVIWAARKRHMEHVKIAAARLQTTCEEFEAQHQHLEAKMTCDEKKLRVYVEVQAKSSSTSLPNNEAAEATDPLLVVSGDGEP